MADVDPALLAISDTLVLHALERAWARTVKRNGRGCNPAQRHNQYLRQPVPEDKVENVLHDAWALCPLLAHRHDLDVDPQVWGDLLHNYTRALLMMCQPHNPHRLTEVLALLGPVHDAFA